MLAAKDKNIHIYILYIARDLLTCLRAPERFESGFNEEPDLAHKAVMCLCMFITFTLVKAERRKVVKILSVGRNTICHILWAFWFLIPGDVFPFHILVFSIINLHMK